jgi:hypothetical protein
MQLITIIHDSFPPCLLQDATVNRKRNSLSQILASAAASVAAACVWANYWGAESGDKEKDGMQQQPQQANVRMPEPPPMESRFEMLLSGDVALLMRGLCNALIRLPACSKAGQNLSAEKMPQVFFIAAAGERHASHTARQIGELCDGHLDCHIKKG